MYESVGNMNDDCAGNKGILRQKQTIKNIFEFFMTQKYFKLIINVLCCIFI